MSRNNSLVEHARPFAAACHKLDSDSSRGGQTGLEFGTSEPGPGRHTARAGWSAPAAVLRSSGVPGEEKVVESDSREEPSGEAHHEETHHSCDTPPEEAGEVHEHRER